MQMKQFIGRHGLRAFAADMYVYARIRVCMYMRRIRDVSVYTYSLWTLCIVCRHCAHTHLPGYSL